MKSGLVTETIIPFIEKAVIATKQNPDQGWENSDLKNTADKIIVLAETWEKSSTLAFLTKPATWKSAASLLSHFKRNHSIIRDGSAFWNTPEAHKITAFVMGATGFKIFSGGVGEVQNFKNGDETLSRGDGVIIDVATPEKHEVPTDELFDESLDLYQKGLEICRRLKAKHPKGKIAAALKVSTIADFDDLKRLSDTILASKDTAVSFGKDTELYNKILSRMRTFLNGARNINIDAYIDAEESSINPAIQHMFFQCLAETKIETAQDWRPSITVQAYLKDSGDLVDKILKMNHPPKIKLVRGAYLGTKRQLREAIWEHSDPAKSKELTDKNFDYLLEKLYNSGKIPELIVATHNEKSLQLAENLLIAGKQQNNPTIVSKGKLKGIGAGLKKSDPKHGIVEMEYQPALLKELALDILGFLPYFVRRGSEFMSQLSEDGKTRADIELEAIDKELARRHFPKLLAERLQKTLNGFIENELLYMGAKKAPALAV